MLIKRNLKLFFRDRAAVFFSLLVVLIIFILYMLFLGDMMEQQLQNQLGFEHDAIGPTMAAIMLGGLVAAASVSSCLGALEISITDKQKALKDFYTSPVPRRKITMGYVFGAGTIGLVMTSISLVLCLAYIVLRGGTLPAGADWGLLALTLFLSVICGNAVMFFITLFVKTSNAFAALSSLVGTMIGFLMGIFIPIGVLPNAVQWVVRIFPMSHGAVMFRQILADGQLTYLFEGMPKENLESFREVQGVVFTYGNFTADFWFSAAVLAGTAVVFFALSVAVMKFRRAE